MRVYLDYWILIVVGRFSITSSVVVNDMNDTIQIHQYDQNDHPITFEAEARHLKEWCKAHDLRYIETRKQEDIDID